MLQRLPALVVGLMTALAGAAAGAADGDAARGERQFQRCYACHSLDPNETATLQGPTLFQIFNRPAATVTGYEYSEAMRAQAAMGLTWDAATLDRYMADPDAVVPGTRMSVPPVRNAQDRADLLAYLARSGSYQR